MDLFILRHGEAGKRSVAARNDLRRALTITGKQEIEEVAKAFVKLGLEFDFVFTSPLIRCKQTAEIILKYVKSKNNVEELNELRPEGNKLELYNKLSKLKQDSLTLLVGHEPYLSELIGEAIGGASRINLKKGGLARIKTISLQPKIRGDLRWLLTPKHMKKISK
jgi:phosphohistidine phosphatase